MAGDAPGVTDALRELGIPGIADLHVHFMPPRVMAAVWRYFDEAGPLLGRPWPVRYRGGDAERVELLRSFGVEVFAPLAYAHKPRMAHFLNDWLHGFAATVPGAVATGTFFPEPGVAHYVDDALRSGCRLFKIHLQVGAFDPRDPVLRPVWGALADSGVPVVVHAGSGPVPGEFTGPRIFGDVMRSHPQLRAIIAHMGMPEEAEFIDMLQRYPAMMLDTTMVGTGFLSQMHEFPAGLLPAVAELGLAGRIVFGSDFPNIPYDYDEAVDALVRWDLGADWLRAVLWDNGAEVLGVGAVASR